MVGREIPCTSLMLLTQMLNRFQPDQIRCQLTVAQHRQLEVLTLREIGEFLRSDQRRALTIHHCEDSDSASAQGQQDTPCQKPVCQCSHRGTRDHVRGLTRFSSAASAVTSPFMKCLSKSLLFQSA